MTKEKNKHDHKLTNLLKVGIFALLMVAPLFASVSQWMYATINKNANQSYSDSTLIKNNTIPTQYNQILEGQIVEFHYSETTNYTNTTTIEYGFSSISFNPLDYGYDDRNWVRIDISIQSNNNYIYLFADNGTYQAKNIWGSSLTEFAIVSNGVLGGTQNQIGNTKTKVNVITYQQQKLDNAFYYGVDQMTESDLFNWTENTTIYTGIKGMTDNLEIQTNAIAILLTYWTILTIVYVIFDILIQGFTFITHKIVE